MFSNTPVSNGKQYNTPSSATAYAHSPRGDTIQAINSPSAPRFPDVIDRTTLKQGGLETDSSSTNSLANLALRIHYVESVGAVAHNDLIGLWDGSDRVDRSIASNTESGSTFGRFQIPHSQRAISGTWHLKGNIDYGFQAAQRWSTAFVLSSKLTLVPLSINDEQW